MGVIWNPEKISNMMDTHIINFSEFIFWGRRGVGAPLGVGEGRYMSDVGAAEFSK